MCTKPLESKTVSLDQVLKDINKEEAELFKEGTDESENDSIFDSSEEELEV